MFESLGSMAPLDIGLVVTGIMFLFVIFGVRVAFAAAAAGFIGLVWIFSIKLGFEKGFIVAVKMAELCLITPPIGLNCFVVAGVHKDISVQDVFVGAAPFFVADAITIAVLVAFPGIVLWLPNLTYY